MDNLITVNSISGGKTSAFLAANYPADIHIFSLVCIEVQRCRPKDPLIVKMVEEKFEKSGMQGDKSTFVATAENDKVLRVVFDLEQLTGKEIIWVRGNSFEQVIKKKGRVVPNMARRFCTTEMKMKPIAEWVYKNVMIANDMKPVISNVGFRYDEKKRAKAEGERGITHKIIVGKRKTRNKWGEINWGIANYPLIEDMINLADVRQYWEGKPLDFPEDSNCVGCFWKSIGQLQQNFKNDPAKMQWFEDIEKESSYNWKSNLPYDKIRSLPIQGNLFKCVGSGCRSGNCTD